MDQHPPQRNLLLATFDPTDRALIQPHMRDVLLHLDEVLCRPGDRIEHVYFPLSGMISIVTMMQNGQGVETGIVGREGASGTCVVGTATARDQCIVQAEGEARRLSSAIFLQTYNRSEDFRTKVNHFNTHMWSMAQQCAACNSLHQLEGRLARWLLQTRDRLQSDVLPLTQELLGLMLAVQRSSVATTMKPLKAEKLISVRRGKVQVLDVEGLKAKSCECYAVMKNRAQTSS